MIGLLAAGFGVLGGRPDQSPEPTLAGLASASAASSTRIVPPRGPMVSPWIECAPPPADPPEVQLQVNGRPEPGSVEVVRSTNGPTPPTSTFANEPPPPRSLIEVPSDAITEIWIVGGACAIEWTIGLGDGSLFESVTNPDLDPAYAAQNRFSLLLTGLAGPDVELRARLVFPTLVARVTWPIHVVSIERPTAILGSVGAETPAVEGCDVVMTLGNGWEDRGAECGDDLNEGPSGALRVEPAEPLTFEVPGWQISAALAVCGRLSGHSFVPAPEPGCTLELGPEDTPNTFPAPAAEGRWTLGISACANQFDNQASNRICGTWYANVEVR